MTNTNGQTSGQSADAKGLFQSAGSDGLLSAGAINAINIHDNGAAINAALGVNVDDVKASEVTLVTQLIDDSGSIRMGSNAQTVRDGHNLVLEALKKSKQQGGILTMCRYLNGTVLYPYMMIDNAVVMDPHNYDPRGGTPLYDESIVTLGAVLAKSQDFTNNGIACRTVTLIMTDGADMGSRKTPADVKKIVVDMLKNENHIVAFMGINDGSTDFRAVARDMGVPDEWILTPGNSASEIRKAFAVFSQSAQRASQSGATFSQAAMGGFGTP